MPELPEVETVVRSVAPFILGETIQQAQVLSSRVTRGDHSAAAAGLTGATVQAVSRHGKQILVEVSTGLLYVHLGMTGKLLWTPSEEAVRPKHTRAVLHFDHGTLIYDDPRMFGRFEFYSATPDSLGRVGPDARGIAYEIFAKQLGDSRSIIKAALLNQRLLAGVGNIYADEALFAARIHPRASFRRLSQVRRQRLHSHLVEILEDAIRNRGSSISDYVDSAGDRGSYQQHHSVYGRAGEPCLRCGAPIRRIVVAQRGTHYCPRCQRS